MWPVLPVVSPLISDYRHFSYVHLWLAIVTLLTVDSCVIKKTVEETQVCINVVRFVFCIRFELRLVNINVDILQSPIWENAKSTITSD